MTDEQTKQQILAIEEQMASVKTIQREVAKYFNIGMDDLVGQSRVRKYARPRQIAMFLCREMVTVNGHQISLPVIGRCFGGRDHTTALWAIHQVNIGWGDGGSVLSSDLQTLRANILAAGDWKPRVGAEKSVIESLKGIVRYAEDAR